jgi:hypothetical protein
VLGRNTASHRWMIHCTFSEGEAHQVASNDPGFGHKGFEILNLNS